MTATGPVTSPAAPPTRTHSSNWLAPGSLQMAPRWLGGGQLSAAGTAVGAGSGRGSAARLLGLNVTHSRFRRRRGLPQPLARISITISVQKERGRREGQQLPLCQARPLRSPPPSVVRGRPLFQGDRGLQKAGERLRLRQATSLSQRPRDGPTSGRPGGLRSLRGLRGAQAASMPAQPDAPQVPILLRSDH